MTYTQFIETISLIIENEKIIKNGLILTYELQENEHNAINEAIFKKSNPYSQQFTPSDEYEVVISGIVINFKKIKVV
jgi:hypothetical protein